MLKSFKQNNKKRRLLELVYICLILSSGLTTLIMAGVLKIPYGIWEGMIFLYTVPLLGVASIFLAIIHYYNFEKGKSNRNLFKLVLIFGIGQVLVAVALYPSNF